jgi:hypothetical protein
MPAGAVRVAAEGMQALPSIAGDIGRVIGGLPSGAAARQAEDFAAYQRSIPPSDVSPLTAFHGTPHRFPAEEGAPLGRFRSEKIGTGEGFQAFGYGLYFAENPGTAKGYAISRGVPDVEGMALRQGVNISRDMRVELMRQAKADRDPLEAAKYLQYANIEARNIPKEKLANIISEYRAAERPSLYTVDIPDAMVDKMLDWNKPLSEQPENVRKFFEPLTAKQKAAALVPSGPEWGDIAAPFVYDPTGAELMQMMGKQEMNASAVLTGGTGGRATSEALRAAGIPGIRYLDQGSRADGQGTRNIVVFPGEEQNVKILSRE